MQLRWVILFIVPTNSCDYILFTFIAQNGLVCDLSFDFCYMLILQLEATPLMYAAGGGHLETVRYLITVGCKKESRNKVIIDSFF